MSSSKRDLPTEFTKILTSLKRKIRKHGFVQEDRRLNRQTYSLPGHFIVLKDPKLLAYLQRQKPLSKYNEDWLRMHPSFDLAVDEANRDPNSRRVMVFNDVNYWKTFQCFTHFQFVLTRRGQWDMYVYQRSADLAKLHDDLVFFSWVANEFSTGKKEVTKIVVVYGHLHYEK